MYSYGPGQSFEDPDDRDAPYERCVNEREEARPLELTTSVPGNLIDGLNRALAMIQPSLQKGNPR